MRTLWPVARSPAPGAATGDEPVPVSGHRHAGGVAAGCPPRLCFNVVDEAVHLLGSEAEPWSIHLEVRVSGRLDEGRLRSAVWTALAGHPMARARKVASRLWDRGYLWEVTPSLDVDPVGVIDCAGDAELAEVRDASQSFAVPLVESPPLRVRLIHHPGGDVVMLNLNHTATDGFGGVRILRSIARAYAGEADPTPDIDQPSARHLQAALAARDHETRSRRARALLRKAGDMVAPPARIAPEDGSARPGYGLHQVSLTTAQTSALLEPRPGGSVNDVLLAALHLAIDGWNTQRGAARRRIGVMLPINLRPPEWRYEVVGNFSLMGTVSTTPGERTTPMTTLGAVNAQTHSMKRGGTGAALIEVLALSPWVPLWAKQATSPLLWLTGNRLVDTAMLSNLGLMDEPPAFGSDAGETVEVWFSPPCRMPLGLALGAVTAAGRLHLAFRYRHPLMGPDAVRRFAMSYVTELDRVMSATRR
jgi:NRPS condensation-like uncharacterized protein